MKNSNFSKNLILHIRYPWTAVCLAILWVGFAIMCAILQFNATEIMILLGTTSVVTLIIAILGFRG